MVIHHVYANRSNIGDWLAARGIQSLLGEQPIVEHFCDEPFVTETLVALAQCSLDDFIIIGGGGLFMDYFSPFWAGFRDIADRLRFCLWGVGYCDLKHEPSRSPSQLLRDVIGMSRLCIVRDDLTRQYLSDCRLPEPVQCPSVLTVHKCDPGHALLHVDNYTTAGADAFEAMQEYGQTFARQTSRPFLRTNNRLDRPDERALQATLQLYATADLILSSALHGCIVGLAMGKRVLAVSGDRKIESCMQALGLSAWVLDIGQIHELPILLEQLNMQIHPSELLAKAGAANRSVAERVLELAIPCELPKELTRVP